MRKKERKEKEKERKREKRNVINKRKKNYPNKLQNENTFGFNSKNMTKWLKESLLEF